MAKFTGDFTALNSFKVLALDNERSGTAVVQYPTGGAGTLQLQGTIDGLEYFVIEMEKVSDHTSFVTDMVASGLYKAEFSGLAGIRLKKTLGAAANAASVGITYN